jgi:hypothetical protein
MPSRSHAQAQPMKCTRSKRDTHSAQQHNLDGYKSPKAVIAANERSIWRPIVERAQRLSIGENNATERGTKARILIGGCSRGKESLMRGRSIAEARLRGGARARTIESKRSYHGAPLEDGIEGRRSVHLA